jgi:DNA polymerase III gamma/tau subunit
MSFSQYAVDLDPINWDDLKFHSKQVNRLRKFLEDDRLPYAMVMSGHTGTGKTTAARLFIKALFCQNRKPGESQPCGECASCKRDPRVSDISNNVMWIQKGQNEETINAQFKRAFEEITKPPYGYDEDHRYYKVLVFDELQNVPKDKLQELLFYPEVPALAERNRVIMIFITMAEQDIKDSVIKPLRDRSRYLRFRKLSEKEIYSYLEEKFKGAPKESLEIIAHYADGSIRSALTAIQDCLEDDKHLNPVSTAETLYYVCKKTRWQIWKMLHRYDYKGLSTFWEENASSFDENKLIQQMLNDIDRAMVTKPTADQLHVVALLYHYLCHPAKIRALDCLKLLIGRDLVDLNETTGSPKLESSGEERLYNQLEGILA